jgi:hypothetical protein
VTIPIVPPLLSQTATSFHPAGYMKKDTIISAINMALPCLTYAKRVIVRDTNTTGMLYYLTGIAYCIMIPRDHGTQNECDDKS